MLTLAFAPDGSVALTVPQGGDIAAALAAWAAEHGEEAAKALEIEYGARLTDEPADDDEIVAACLPGPRFAVRPRATARRLIGRYTVDGTLKSAAKGFDLRTNNRIVHIVPAIGPLATVHQTSDTAVTNGIGLRDGHTFAVAILMEFRAILFAMDIGADGTLTGTGIVGDYDYVWNETWTPARRPMFSEWRAKET